MSLRISKNESCVMQIRIFCTNACYTIFKIQRDTKYIIKCKQIKVNRFHILRISYEQYLRIY